MSALPEPSYAEAVTELARLARWSKGDVKDQPRDASWVAYAWISKCRAVIEAGDQ